MHEDFSEVEAMRIQCPVLLILFKGRKSAHSPCPLSKMLSCLPDCVLVQTSSKSRSLLIDSMVNDSSKEARVKLEGMLNGQPFTVERAVKVCLGTH